MEAVGRGQEDIRNCDRIICKHVGQLEMDKQECIVRENNFDHYSRSKGQDKTYFSIQYFKKHTYSQWF